MWQRERNQEEGQRQEIMHCYYCDVDTDDRYCSHCERDSEGFTWQERQKKRPRHEIAGITHSVKTRKRKGPPLPFADAVVPGSVRMRTLG